MYNPKSFREDDVDVLHKTMREIGAGTLVSTGPDGLIASHVPIELSADPAPNGTIRCHLARPNPQVAAVENGGEAMLIFQGPQSYISPNWYPSKHQTAKAVPTWNYVAIHAYGPARTFDGEKLIAHLAAMTDHFEASQALPWKVSDAPEDYIAAMCKAIIGIEIPLQRIEGKWKMSQNKSEHDLQGSINGLRAEGRPAASEVAEIMAKRS
jgi:transcriptional regulator